MVNASHAISDKLGNNSEGEKGTIKITAKIHSENAEVTITDSGSGMPEEVQKQIFDPFYTTKEVGRGSGQGLAIVHDVITNKHGGSIYVESELGKGTTFIIQLPLSA
jgi:signal transduction histidine kinase